MRTLYLRNVPDEVLARLEALARRSSMSVSAVAVRELDKASRHADNPALLDILTDHKIDVARIVEELDAGRSER